MAIDDGTVSMATNSTLTNVRWLVSRFLSRHGLRDPAPSAETWNAEYLSGRWDYLGHLPELSRFSILVGYLRHFRPGGSILDIGCGEGVLLRRLQPVDYTRYVGVDLSSTAIDKASAGASIPNATFSAADGELYVPTGTFDAIVFNEVLYFFSDPLRSVENYAHALRKGGVFLISTNTAFRGGLRILDGLKRKYRLLDETRVTHGDNEWSWVCTVLSGA